MDAMNFWFKAICHALTWPWVNQGLICCDGHCSCFSWITPSNYTKHYVKKKYFYICLHLSKRPIAVFLFKSSSWSRFDSSSNLSQSECNSQTQHGSIYSRAFRVWWASKAKWICSTSVFRPICAAMCPFSDLKPFEDIELRSPNVFY